MKRFPVARDPKFEGHWYWQFAENSYFNIYAGDRGSTVVKVQCYKSEGRWFDPS